MAPTEWNDAGREELFAKIFNLATTRSRNFRVFVTGQSLDKNGNVLSTVTKVYQVFVKPNRDPTTGAIQKDPSGTPIQQVVIRVAVRSHVVFRCSTKTQSNRYFRYGWDHPGGVGRKYREC